MLYWQKNPNKPWRVSLQAEEYHWVRIRIVEGVCAGSACLFVVLKGRYDTAENGTRRETCRERQGDGRRRDRVTKIQLYGKGKNGDGRKSGVL